MTVAEDSVAYRYTGAGPDQAFYSGVPARDLTEAEYNALPPEKQDAVARGGYSAEDYDALSKDEQAAVKARAIYEPTPRTRRAARVEAVETPVEAPAEPVAEPEAPKAKA